MLVLAAIAVPSYNAIYDNAEENIALTNVTIVEKFVKMAIIGEQYSNEEKFTYIPNQTSVSANTNYLSRYVEIEWEDSNGDGTEYVDIQNPPDGRIGVVNSSDPLSLCTSNEVFRQQALYITDSADLAYVPGSPTRYTHSYFNSAIIMWYDDAVANNIYFYYIDHTGTQSDDHFVLVNDGD